MCEWFKMKRFIYDHYYLTVVKRGDFLDCKQILGKLAKEEKKMKVYMQIATGSEVLYYQEEGSDKTHVLTLYDTQRKPLGLVLDRVLQQYPEMTEYLIADLESPIQMPKTKVLRSIRQTLDKVLEEALQKKGIGVSHASELETQI